MLNRDDRIAASTILPPLQQYLSERYPGAVVTGFDFLTSGFESDVYAFVLHRPSHAAQSLILRLYPGEGAAPRMARESGGLVRLQKAGYPVPVMLLSEPDPSVLGKPFNIVERLEGSSLWPVLANAVPEQQEKLLWRFSGLLAQLHRLDWHPFVVDSSAYEMNPALLMMEIIAASRQQYIQCGVPGFLDLCDWLENQLGQIQIQPAVVHLDFHANNVFLRSDDGLAVIDWTQLSVADYRCDLSWTLMIMGDFGSAQWARSILESYREAAGKSVKDLPYFDVISYSKFLSSMAILYKNILAQPGMRSESDQSIQQQAPVMRMLYQRIEEITGLVVPEVEAMLA